MFKEFKKFIARGSVIDLAVGLMMGSAFTAIITSLNADILSPLISIPLKTVDLDNWKFTIGNTESVINIGAFIQSIITFLMTAVCLFLIVKAMNKARDLTDKKEEEVKKAEDPAAETAQYLKEIRDLLAQNGTDLEEIVKK